MSYQEKKNLSQFLFAKFQNFNDALSSGLKHSNNPSSETL